MMRCVPLDGANARRFGGRSVAVLLPKRRVPHEHEGVGLALEHGDILCGAAELCGDARGGWVGAGAWVRGGQGGSGGRSGAAVGVAEDRPGLNRRRPKAQESPRASGGSVEDGRGPYRPRRIDRHQPGAACEASRRPRTSTPHGGARSRSAPGAIPGAAEGTSRVKQSAVVRHFRTGGGGASSGAREDLEPRRAAHLFHGRRRSYSGLPHSSRCPRRREHARVRRPARGRPPGVQSRRGRSASLIDSTDSRSPTLTRTVRRIHVK